MFRKTLLFLLAGCICFAGGAPLGAIQAKAETEGLIIDQDKLILKQIDHQSVQKEARTFQLPVLTEEGVMEKGEDPESKITYLLREELELNQNKVSTFDVEVLVHFNYTDEEFEQAFKEWFGDVLELKKRKHKSYLVENIKYEQIIRLEQVKEVLVIASIHNYQVPDQIAGTGDEILFHLQHP